MKFTLKLIAASLALAAAGQASAAILDFGTAGNTGGGEMFLAVWDQAGEKSYVRDLGIRFNDFLPAASLGLNTGLAGNKDKTSTGALLTAGTVAPFGGVGVNNVAFGATMSGAPVVSAGTPLTAGYILNFAADPTLASFMGSTLSTNFKWMVGAFDSTGSQVSTGQNNRALTTSNDDVAASGQNNAQLGQFATANNYLANNNAKAGMAANNGSATASIALGDTVAYFGNGIGANWANKASFSSLADVGSSAKFWYLGNSSGVASDKATVIGFTDATWTLGTNGSLSYVASVPVPAAAWLLGSGLMGLIGAGYRKGAGKHSISKA